MKKYFVMIIVGIIVSALLLFFGYLWTAFILTALLILTSVIIFNGLFTALVGCFEELGLQMSIANFRSMFYKGKTVIEEFNEYHKNGGY